ncbi:hypothetical protein RJ639_038664 [Escallonia herrerae]|uniref:Uncharacterized protein n=1 Tax=Escallonia herrerae TaxID=1293975 RepID=A0AA89BAF9_9ASTE|nr:hypothetical protein RJ639_038664 [Escallonia herrerae]
MAGRGAICERKWDQDVSVNLVSTFMYTEDAYGRVISLNIYGCIMDDKVWEHPKEWRREGFLDENNDSVDLYKMMTFGGGKEGMCCWCTSNYADSSYGNRQIYTRV